MNSKSTLAVSALALGIAAFASGPIAAAATPAPADAAQDSAHSHAHGADAPKLELNAGKKWATDDALRKGMSGIRGVVEPRLADVHRGKVGAAQYAKMANDIEIQVGYIVSNCKLDPKADAVLHGVLAEVAQGVEAMAGKQKDARPEQGVVQVIGALNEYGNHFSHPGWKQIATGH